MSQEQLRDPARARGEEAGGKLQHLTQVNPRPAYSVEIHGDGSVIYSSESFVVVTGTHRDHLSAMQVEELIEAFRKADHFSLGDGYSPAVPVSDDTRRRFV